MHRNLIALLGLAAFAAVAVFTLFTGPSATPIGALIVAALVLHDMRNPTVGHFSEAAIVAGVVLFGMLLEAFSRPPTIERFALIAGLIAVGAFMIFLEVRERRAASPRALTHPRPHTG